MAWRRINPSQVLCSSSGSRCPSSCRHRAPTSIDKLCDKRGILVNLLPAHTKLVQLLEEGSPGRVNVLGVKAYVRIPANMAHMPKVGGEADTGLVKLAIVHWDLVAALSSSRLARFCQCTCRRDGFEWSQSCSSKHFSIKYVCFVLIRKRESSDMVIGLEGMKEGSVLRVYKPLVEFLLPNDSLSIQEVNYTKVERVAGLDQGDGAKDARVGPLIWVWVGDVKSCHCCCDDPGVRQGQEPFNGCLVLGVV